MQNITIKEFVEQKVKEYKEAYRGLLLPDTIDGGVEWYRSSLRAVAEKAHKEGFEEAVEKVRGEVSKRIIKELTTFACGFCSNCKSSLVCIHRIEEDVHNHTLSDLLASLKTLEKETL